MSENMDYFDDEIDETLKIYEVDYSKFNIEKIEYVEDVDYIIESIIDLRNGSEWCSFFSCFGNYFFDFLDRNSFDVYILNDNNSNDNDYIQKTIQYFLQNIELLNWYGFEINNFVIITDGKPFEMDFSKFNIEYDF